MAVDKLPPPSPHPPPPPAFFSSSVKILFVPSFCAAAHRGEGGGRARRGRGQPVSMATAQSRIFHFFCNYSLFSARPSRVSSGEVGGKEEKEGGLSSPLPQKTCSTDFLFYGHPAPPPTHTTRHPDLEEGRWGSGRGAAQRV